MSITKGTQAPDFSLISDEKKEVALSALENKNKVLLFFPAAFTGVCTTELCSVRDNIADYNNLNAEVMGISVDMPYTLAKLKEEQKLNFPLLSDFNKEVSQKYETIYDEFVLGLKGVSKRSAFVIDKNNVVQYAEVLDDAGQLPNFDAIKETLASLS